MEDNINDLVVPIDPYILVEVEQGVSVDTIESDGVGEIPVDNKYAGMHMDICKILRVNRTYYRRFLNSLGITTEVMVRTLDEYEALSAGDRVLVWSTAVKPFDIKGYGRIYLVKEADIFCKINRHITELVPGLDYPD